MGSRVLWSVALVLFLMTSLGAAFRGRRGSKEDSRERNTESSREHNGLSGSPIWIGDGNPASFVMTRLDKNGKEQVFTWSGGGRVGDLSQIPDSPPSGFGVPMSPQGPPPAYSSGSWSPPAYGSPPLSPPSYNGRPLTPPSSNGPPMSSNGWSSPSSHNGPHGY
eukprot:TRINITY_DN57185_c0_g1_i1.p1 TRINITY_DN57185_c0_g1~~TRINITY_DN57185_c0_g1_i1.p1  ORF type:complete len:164 (-),score=14.25 TRINITY_DN57185_c0_g1_i1:143-634(-)